MLISFGLAVHGGQL